MPNDRYDFEFDFSWLDGATTATNEDAHLVTISPKDTLSFIKDVGRSMGYTISGIPMETSYKNEASWLEAKKITKGNPTVDLSSDPIKLTYTHLYTHSTPDPNKYSCCSSYHTCYGRTKKVNLKLTKALRKIFPSIKDHMIDNEVRKLYSKKGGYTFEIIPFKDQHILDKEYHLRSCMVSASKWAENVNPYMFYEKAMENVVNVLVTYRENGNTNYGRFLLHAVLAKRGKTILCINRLYGFTYGVVEALKKISEFPIYSFNYYRDEDFGSPRYKPYWFPIGKFNPDNIEKCRCGKNETIPYFDGIALNRATNIVMARAYSSNEIIYALPKTILKKKPQVGVRNHDDYAVFGSEHAGCRCNRTDYRAVCSVCSNPATLDRNGAPGIEYCHECWFTCPTCQTACCRKYDVHIDLKGNKKTCCSECIPEAGMCARCYNYYSVDKNLIFKYSYRTLCYNCYPSSLLVHPRCDTCYTVHPLNLPLDGSISSIQCCNNTAYLYLQKTTSYQGLFNYTLDIPDTKEIEGLQNVS